MRARPACLPALIALAALLSSCAPPSAYSGGFRPPRASVSPPSDIELARRERDMELAAAYAPVLFHATRASERPASWDTPARVDFDGDLVASNNEESLVGGLYPITPAVYYAVLETETHLFLTYGLYHPIDWSTMPPVFPYTWHENDMENVQIVVEKRDGGPGSVVLVAAQAHLGTNLYAAPGSGVSSGSVELSDRPLLLFGPMGAGTGHHAAVYVESGGHGIYSLTDAPPDIATSSPPRILEGFVFFPSHPTDPAAPPPARRSSFASAPYELLPIYDTFWAPYLDGSGLGDGRLLDGSFNYYERDMAWDHVPRHLDSDRLSGPCKSDSGILPFAFGFTLADLDLGSLFFHPAEKYAESLTIARPWSTTYLRHPYRR